MTGSGTYDSPSAADAVLSMARPWPTGAASIYEFLRAEVVRDGRYQDFIVGLPDDPPRVPGRVGFAPGAIGHIFGPNAVGPEAGKPVFLSLQQLARWPSARRLDALYQRLLHTDVLAVADQLVANFRTAPSWVHNTAYAIGRLLALEAPKREPVKFGIALLGVFGTADDVEALTTLGVCGEFTPFVRVALKYLLPDAEDALVEMARHSDGWTKADLVMELCRTERADIKRWLLLEGFENTIVGETTAHLCAEAGGLAAMLASPLDAPELDAVSWLMAMLTGGPTFPPNTGIFQLADRHLIVRRYLDQAIRAAPTFDVVNGLIALRRSIQKGQAAPPTGATLLIAACDQYFERDDVRARLQEWSASPDKYVAETARRALPTQG